MTSMKCVWSPRELDLSSFRATDMKCTIPEISWHNRDPVLSVDIQLKNVNEDFYRIASAGTDSHVLIWQAKLLDNGNLDLECISDLTRHQKAVNVVRFSPCGALLASGDDDSVIIIWRKKTDQDKDNIFEDDAKEAKDNSEYWIQEKILRGHLNDVYDVSWSPDSTRMISGSVDNTAIIWDIPKGKKIKILDDHKNFVQGVTWDPMNQFLATLSSDSVCRVYCAKTFNTVNRMSRTRWFSQPADSKPTRLFHDDTLKTFFRRLSFTPDGKLLIAPSGIIEQTGAKPSRVTWVFRRKNFSSPVMFFPSLNQSTTVVKCCPQLFSLRPKETPIISLPYRVVIAVATKTSILLYDTQHAIPIGLISNIHYTKLTDLTWSADGRLLVASSTDGYCSLITFAKGELGTPYNPSESEGPSTDPPLTSVS